MIRTYRAGEIGSCTRKQVAIHLGYSPLDPSERMRGLYDRGQDVERECLAAMAADGQVVVHTLDGYPTDDKYGEPRVLIDVEIPKDIHIRGRLDGVLIGERRPKVLEIKAPFTFHAFEKAVRTNDFSTPHMHTVAYQVSFYMTATGLECVMATVEDGQVHTFGIETPPFSMAEIRDRVDSMEIAIGLGQLPRECSQADYPCPVVYLHDAPERPETEDGELDRLVGLYGAEKALRDAADARMKQYREEIDAHLGLDDTRETASSIATRVTTTRATLDKAAVRAAGIDLVPFERQSVSTSIRVTVKGEPGE